MSDTPFYFEPQPWMASANCRGCNTDDFFPERGVNKANMAAVEICAGCTVRDECLQYALDHNESGIWGGTTSKERRRIKRDQLKAQRGIVGTDPGGRPPLPIMHGTVGGAWQHVRRGEDLCDECRKARAAYNNCYRSREAS